MNTLSKRIRDSFIAELVTEGDVWRILRKGTLVDLIKLSFFHFQKEKKENYLIEIINYSMKIKLLQRIKTIEIKGSFEEVSKKFYQETEFVLSQYDEIFVELEPTFETYVSANLYDLNSKVQYLKVVNELKVDSYSDNVFNEIIGICYNLLVQTE